MVQVLLFVAVIAGLVSIVPLATLAATGRWRDAWDAFRGYVVCLGILASVSAVFVAAALVGSIP